MKKSLLFSVGGPILFLIIMILIIWLFSDANSGLIMPIPEVYTVGGGAKFASLLAQSAQKLSILYLILGWLFICIAALLAITGAIVGSKRIDDYNSSILKILASQRGLVLGTLAILSGGLGWQLLYRSSDASQTASVATLAIAEAKQIVNEEKKDTASFDRMAYEACVKAKAVWLEGRMNHDQVQSITNSFQTITMKNNNRAAISSQEKFGKKKD